jgi:hypothetical protein
MLRGKQKKYMLRVYEHNKKIWFAPCLYEENKKKYEKCLYDKNKKYEKFCSMFI